MARSDIFRCSVVTPERVIVECDARFVALPAHDGEIGILRDRAPLVCKLDVGRLRIETAAENLAFYVDGGFAEMSANELTILTEEALRPEDLDRSQVEASLAEARDADSRDEAAFQARQRALKRARVQLRMLGGQ